MSSWKPGTSQDTRIARSQLYQQIRQFFSRKNFIEVDPPLLGTGGTTDPHIESYLAVEPLKGGQDQKPKPLYLQTSPEFYMKRLLCAGSGPIYALTKSFRCGEQGRLHNSEFTILEWYQPGFTDWDLMGQVEELFIDVFQTRLKRTSYQQCFQDRLDINPHTVVLQTLEELGKKHLNVDWENVDKDTWLEALFSHCVQPTLEEGEIVFDYPESQAALAKIKENENGIKVAKRFEVFAKGLELGNGYWELTDYKEQEQRFSADNHERKNTQQSQISIDGHLLKAMEHGLPDCAGIAFGVDRLLLLKLGLTDLDEAMDFTHKRT